MKTLFNLLLHIVLLGSLVLSIVKGMQFVASVTLILIFISIILTYMGRVKK